MKSKVKMKGKVVFSTIQNIENFIFQYLNIFFILCMGVFLFFSQIFESKVISYYMYILTYTVVAGILVHNLMPFFIKTLKKMSVFAIFHEDRSLHKEQTVVGAGILIFFCILIFIIGFVLFSYHFPMRGSNSLSKNIIFVIAIILISIAILSVISFLDDLYDISAVVRFTIHIIVAILGVMLLNPQGIVFMGHLPKIADQILCVLLLVWMLNLYNFMDGSDNISSNEAMTTAIGVILISFIYYFLYSDNGISGIQTEFFITGKELGIDFVILCAGLVLFAFMGFHRWNFHPCQIFLGDSGAIPLGFIVGGMLIILATNDYMIESVILVLYHAFDASLTLLMRLLRGKKIWVGEADFFYNKSLCKVKRSYRDTATIIQCCNFVLLLISVVSALNIIYGWTAFMIACGVVLFTLRSLIDVNRAIF